MEYVYYEYLNDEDGSWHLGYMPADKALISQLVLGGDRFHYLDESMIMFDGE